MPNPIPTRSCAFQIKPELKWLSLSNVQSQLPFPPDTRVCMHAATDQLYVHTPPQMHLNTHRSLVYSSNQC